MTSPVPAEPATPADARRRLVDAKRTLFARIIASAHLLEKPFSNAPDQSPWTRISRTMAGLDAAVKEIARSTDPVPIGSTIGELLHKLGVADIQTAHEQAHRLGFRVWELAGDSECTPLGSVLEQALELLADPGPAPTTPLDEAAHSVWLHGNWRWLTRNMATEEREAFADAVDRVHTRNNADEPELNLSPVDRWWRDDGPLSSVPPGAEPGSVVDSCLSCNGPLVRRDGKLVHQATGERTCPPPGTEASQ